MDYLVCTECNAWLKESELAEVVSLGYNTDNDTWGIVAVACCPDCYSTNFNEVGVWVGRTRQERLDRCKHM